MSVFAASGSILASGRSAGAAEDQSSHAVPFEGIHQAGITTPEQRFLAFAAFDVTAGNGDDLQDLLASWTAAAARLAAGEQLAGPSGIYAPPADTGETLGFAPARLTLTFGLGPSLFDDRFGLHDKRPVALVDLPGFPGDALDTSLSGGDLCIQACADDAQVAFHAIHNLSRLALGAAVLRYVHCGFAASAVGPPAPRNLLGFQDGTANLDAADSAAMDRHVWVGDDNDQAWMRGGTYLVFRRIRIHLEQWDRMTLDDQEQTIGRKKDTGLPLGTLDASYVADLSAVGPNGVPVIPDSAHIRVASPVLNNGAAILRRGYSFADGIDPESGELDAGLLFICFQSDPGKQFIPIQQRLASSDALSDFLLPTGSAVFACPPGVRGTDPIGSALF
jgi:deferrochelatase/peroxidase EfeB